MSATTGHEGAASTPLSPELSELLREAALIHGLDATAAEQVGATGVLDANGAPVVTMSVPPGDGKREITYNDVALVSPLAYIKTPTASQLSFLLEANFPIMSTLGCAISLTKEGVLQVIHSTRLSDLTPRRLAEKQWSVLAVVVSIRQQLEEHTKANPPPAGLSGGPRKTGPIKAPVKPAGIRPRA